MHMSFFSMPLYRGKILKSISMRKAKLSLNFSSYSDANFETKALLVLNSMTGNANFPSPVPTLADLQTATDTYSTALVAAAGSGTNNVALKNAARSRLDGVLVQLGMYVMFIANGDEAILVSSGFSLAKIPQARYITNPGTVTLANGNSSGEMSCSVKAVKGATTYLHQITNAEPADATVWGSNTSTRSQFTFKGLEPGKKYWVRVAATGSGEQIAYSPVASMFAQ
jgi:hypothetical protein